MGGDLKLKNNNYKKYSLTWENSTANVERYTFSPSIYIEFTELSATDYSIGTYKGANQFRIDYTKIGRYECEFLDHTYSYRGENEITILTTTESGEWVVSASIPTKAYNGCVLIIEYDKLTDRDKELFIRFGIDINSLTEAFNSKLKWCKIADDDKYTDIFAEMYDANKKQNAELIFVKALELLVLSASDNKAAHIYPAKACYLPSKQVELTKEIHAFILKKYGTFISFEKLASDYGITYSLFNDSFKIIYGDTPYQYLKKLRMNIAAEKLKSTNLSTTEIANSVGYTNASKFASAFKSIHGKLPHEFKK
ncbi:MAG: helix-turn-helix domain-containing protein [Velocimicrobium sp.]